MDCKLQKIPLMWDLYTINMVYDGNNRPDTRDFPALTVLILRCVILWLISRCIAFVLVESSEIYLLH
jgi:hypothetical protein